MFGFKKNNLEKIKSFIRKSEEIRIDNKDKEDLIKMIRPTIGIRTESNDDEKIKIGKSKIGGKPDLPINFEWPKINGKPMLFCAQYNLSELTKYDKENLLPKRGFFYIFLSLDEKYNEFNISKQSFMFLFNESENIIRTEFPNGYEKTQAFKSAEIKYNYFYTLPDDENYKLTEYEERYNNFHLDFYHPTEEYINEEIYPDLESLHQILGHDRSIQSSIVYDFASIELGLHTVESSVYQNHWEEILELSKTFELLIQLDCFDSNTDLSKFGGSGTFYFGISKIELEQRNFKNIKMAFQTT